MFTLRLRIGEHKPGLNQNVLHFQPIVLNCIHIGTHDYANLRLANLGNCLRMSVFVVVAETLKQTVHDNCTSHSVFRDSGITMQIWNYYHSTICILWVSSVFIGIRPILLDWSKVQLQQADQNQIYKCLSKLTTKMIYRKNINSFG